MTEQNRRDGAWNFQMANKSIEDNFAPQKMAIRTIWKATTELVIVAHCGFGNDTLNNNVYVRP